MKEEILEEIMRECGIKRRKAEELFKITTFYDFDISNAKKLIKEFYLSKTCPKK